MNAYPGYTINDVLKTDYRLLNQIVSAQNTSKQQKESGKQPVDLVDFVRAL